MRYSSAILLVAAASEAFAGTLRHRDIRQRAVRIDTVVVTQEIVVTKYADGVLKTAEAEAVGTQTHVGEPQVETSIQAVSTIEDLPTSVAPAPVPTTTSQAPAVFKEVAPVSEAPKVESVAAPAPEPTTTTIQIEEPAAIVAPTTLAKVISSAAPVATSAPSTSTGGKRGIAYNEASFLPAFSSASSVSWCYNWGGNTATVPSNFEFVPMLWGLGEHANNWERYADTAIAAGSTHLLAFNEPDHGEQASTGPQPAADGYMQHMQPYAGKAKLGAPAVTNGGGEMGLTWLGNFMSACSACTIDFVPVHWYNGGDVAAFKTHMEKAYEVGGKRPIWITEFEAPGSIPEQVAFLAELLPWLDSQDWIERYSLFMASEGRMITGGGLSEIGKAFIA